MIIKPETIELRFPYLLVEEFTIQSDSYVTQNTLEDKPFFGKVINLAPSVDVCLHDIVMFGQHSTTRVEINGKNLFLLRMEDIIGTVNK